jgi:type I restriction enzyme S subunit
VAVVTLNLNSVNPVYLSALLTTERGQWMLLNNSVEGARANISLTDIRQLEIPIPPSEVQRKFAHRVAVVKKLKAAQHAALAELDAVFASLQYRAFHGDLEPGLEELSGDAHVLSR